MKTLFAVAAAMPFALASFAAGETPAPTDAPAAELCLSGRYPHLAMFNHFLECGTGAVVPWADRLWVITYAPHEPNGSDDKLYEIDGKLQRVIRPESVGGTPADRMVHRESNQLVIGPYFIDANRNVRAIPPGTAPGRLTAAARDLTDPAGHVYLYDMEGTLYEVDVKTLAANKIVQRAAEGAHGKGAYTGQGRLVVANNGNDIVNKAAPAAASAAYGSDPESCGALAEWDGKTWTLVEGREFTDVTGPGGLSGSPDETAPLWALGWDKRSVILKLLDGGRWSQYRLPIADFSYVARHGWFTEWPRIRDVGGDKRLMNMHGGWFDFPGTFGAGRTGGIRPIGDYLKITGDFCRFGGRIVFGCDDASMLGNPLLGQSQSNLWFATRNDLQRCGAPAGAGGPWLRDAVKAGVPSDAYLLAGYGAQRVVHLSQDSDLPVRFTLEIDARGDGRWTPAGTIAVPPHGYACEVLPADLQGEWVRVKADHDCTATAWFIYGPGGGATTDPQMLAALAGGDRPLAATATTIVQPLAETGTLLVTLPDGSRQEIDPALRVKPFGGELPVLKTIAGKPLPKKNVFSGEAYKLSADPASLVFTLGGQRFRLPVAVDALNTPEAVAGGRNLREFVTERYMLNAGGSFFVVPQPSAGGIRRMKPVATHGRQIADYCSWRGLSVLVGPRGEGPLGANTVALPDGQNVAWFGDIDDFWRAGKPRGHGGPWLHTAVEASTPSDPYLMTGYDQKTLTLANEGPTDATITLEVDVAANNVWQVFKTVKATAGQTVKYTFPTGYSVPWVRLTSDRKDTFSAQFDYQ